MMKSILKSKLSDNYGRLITYLRISVTDRCNFRCLYCQPDEKKYLPVRELLSYEEIKRVVDTALNLGITKFRVTGGEPLLRPGIIGFLEELIGTDGVEWVSLTTNGSRLPRYADHLSGIGLNSINISLNSLQEETFTKLSGVPDFQKVKSGIESLIKAGYYNIKLNTVLMRGFNDGEILDFARFAIKYPITLRFIEHMPCGRWENDSFSYTIPAYEILRKISALGNLTPVFKQIGNGPAKYYQLDGAKGLIGFIAPVSEPFCNSCNRLRLTADGQLKACLLSSGSIDLKPILRNSHFRKDDLSEAFSHAALLKPRLHMNEELTVMSRVGG